MSKGSAYGAFGEVLGKTGRRAGEFLGGLFRRGGDDVAEAAARGGDDIVDIYRGVPGFGRAADDVVVSGGGRGIRDILSRPIGLNRASVLPLGLAGLAGYTVYNRAQNMENPLDWRGFLGIDQGGGTSTFPTSPGGTTATQQAIAEANEASALKELFGLPEFKSTYTSPGYAAAVEALNAKQAADLESYLRQALGSATQGGRGIASGYAGLAKGTGNLAQRTQVGGQQLAGDIDRLYQELGLTQADLAAQAQVPTSGVDVSGLTGVSGEMATAPDVTTAYGGGLADYLGQEATLDAQALEAMARSQAGYGASAASDLVNAINMMAAQQRLAASNRAAERLFQAQQAEAQDRRAFEAGERGAAQERALRIWEASRGDAATRSNIQKASNAARAQVDASFASASDDQKKVWARIANVRWKSKNDDNALRGAMKALVAEDPLNASIRFGLYGAQG